MRPRLLALIACAAIVACTKRSEFYCERDEDCAASDYCERTRQVCLPRAVDAAAERGADGGQDVDTGPPDTTPPTVSSTVPPADAADVEVGAAIRVTLSEPMSALPPGSITLRCDGETIDGSVTTNGADATFTPSDALPLASSCEASVTKAAIDAAGNPLAAAHSWTFSTRDGEWSAIETLSTGTNITFPSLAVDGRGRVVAVSSRGGKIEARRFEPGGTWGAPEQIADHESGDPQVGVDADGNAIVAWTYKSTGDSDVWAARYTSSSGSWGAPDLIETISGDADNLRLAVSANGRALAIWLHDDGASHSIRGNRFDGSAWTGLETLDTSAMDNDFHPDLAMNAAGVAVAVWTNEGDNTVYTARHEGAGSTWGDSKKVSQIFGFSPRVAVDEDGNAIATWVQPIVSPQVRLLGCRYDEALGSWGTPTEIDAAADETVGFYGLAFDNKGDAIVVWATSHKAVWTNRYVRGFGWSVPEVIGAIPHLTWVELAVDAAGRAVAVWPRQPDGRLWWSRYDGSSWSKEQALEKTSSHSWNLELVVDSRRRVTAAWRKTDTQEIHAARFE